MSEKLQGVGREGKKLLPSFPSLQGDIWASFYKLNPQVQDDVEKDLLTNKLLMEQIMNHPSYQQYRDSTKLDDLTSAIACLSMSKETQQWLENEMHRNQQLRNAFEQLQQKQEQYQQQKKKENKKALDDAQKQFQQQIEQMIQQNIHGLDQHITSALEGAKQTKENLKSLVSGLTPGSGEAELKKIPLRDQIALAEQLETNPKMKKIAEWAGRFKQIAKKKQKSKHDESTERSGLGLGNRMERLLPTELAMYSHPATRLDFLRRFAEKQTMIYDPTGKDALGKGPIVLCLDQSGSMNNFDSQAKGFALALMSIARKKKRDFALILFDVLTKTFQYPKGKITPQDMVELATTYMGGGTNFELPLTEAIKIISTHRFKEADIVFVTDGADNLSDTFLNDFHRVKNEKKFNVISVLLGQALEDTVRRFSDEVIHASDFIEASEIVFNI
jgi:uncharacterized protein with von Willebrand factor type A (vWA) domain